MHHQYKPDGGTNSVTNWREYKSIMDIKKTLHSTVLSGLRGVLLLSFSVSFIVACNSDDQPDTKNEVKQSHANKIMLSIDGIGPINALTPFNMHQVTRAFQNYSVTEYTQFNGANTEPVLRVSEGGKPLLLINPDPKTGNIFSVFILSNKIGNALGHDIGTAYNTIYSYGKTQPCITGTEEFTGKVLCIAPKAQNILYVFKGSWEGPSNEVPPLAILSQWRLNTIVWKPRKLVSP